MSSAAPASCVSGFVTDRLTISTRISATSRAAPPATSSRGTSSPAAAVVMADSALATENGLRLLHVRDAFGGGDVDDLGVGRVLAVVQDLSLPAQQQEAGAAERRSDRRIEPA